MTGSRLGELTLLTATLEMRVQRGYSAELQLRRFASNYRYTRVGDAPPVFHLPRLLDGRAMILQLPRDHSSIPWRARVVGGRHVTVCAFQVHPA